MMKILITMTITLYSLIMFADVQNVDNDDQSPPADPMQTSQQLEPVQNLENIIPSPVNTNNQALMQALNDDPMLKTSPISQNPNSNDLSGQAEENIVNADGATFSNMNNQLNTDIESANQVIYKPSDDGMAEAAEISKEMGLNDVNNLSIPKIQIPTGNDVN